jgi:hypothetical protein
LFTARKNVCLVTVGCAIHGIAGSFCAFRKLPGQDQFIFYDQETQSSFYIEDEMNAG